MSNFAAYARALDALEAYRARQLAGAAEPAVAFLAAHADLAEILQPMLADVTLGGPTAATAPTAPWRGLPGDGDAFGGYRIERLLGQGGMGVVYLAEDTRLNRKVALKLVRPERLGSKPALERFAREAKLAARLEHPNICPVYEVGEVDGTPFLAMRFLAGETLAAQLARASPATTPTTPRTGNDAERRRIDAVLQLCETVARALHFAHERGVVHRDVKPANILIDADGTPIVLDFGMARGADDDLALTMTGELAGTPLYMAPEQVTPSARGTDHRADVYALGVTLYEATTGRRPFSGQSMRELLDAIARDTAPPASTHNRGLPPDLDVVIEKALEKDVDRRYRTAADLADDLARVRAHVPVLARRAGPLLRAHRWVQRNPVAVAFLALAATALVVITIFYRNAEAARRDFELVAFVPRLEELQRQEVTLNLGWPQREADLDAWLARARELSQGVDTVRRTLARFGETDDPATVTTQDPALRFLRDTLRGVVAQTEALTRDDGIVARARRNRACIERERARQAADGALWDAATSAIRASPRYAGLSVSPQLGLVPLEPDPTTGLWEFWHARSGTRPMRNERGRWRVDEDTGIVFVLVPGGTFVMGAQYKSEQDADYDAFARAEEGPPHRVALDAFFLAKHELTQGQWMRLSGGDNPAEARPGSDFRLPLTLAHPVEMVSWHQSTTLLASAGLTLPTEAQWEYACRGGGAPTPWWTGDEAQTLSGRENVADKAAATAGAKDAGGAWVLMIDESVDDGYLWHAPVDALEPNGYGLMHMAGNVQEWCRDRRQPYGGNTVLAPGDGLRGQLEGSGPRVVRGSTFDSSPRRARTTSRFAADPAQASGNTGVRAARAIR